MIKKIYYTHKLMGPAVVIVYLIIAVVCPLLLTIYKIAASPDYLRNVVQLLYQLIFPLCAAYLVCMYVKDRVEVRGREALLRFENDQIGMLFAFMIIMWFFTLISYLYINFISDVYLTDILRSLLQIAFQFSVVTVLSYLTKSVTPAFAIALIYEVICLVTGRNSLLSYINYNILSIGDFVSRYYIIMILTVLGWAAGWFLNKKHVAV